MDRIFTSFIERITADAIALAASSDLIEISPEPGDRPQRFLIELRCRGLVRDDDGPVEQTERFLAGVWFRDDYLRGPPDPFRLVTWLGPAQSWHPNIAYRAPFVCLGHLNPGTDLVTIAYQLYEIVTYQKFAAHDGLNEAACAWVRSQPDDRFPIDPRPLRWTAAVDGGAS